jgi:hypothetical protein
MSKMPKRLLTADVMRQISAKAIKRIEGRNKIEQQEAETKRRREQEAAIRRTMPRLLVRSLEQMFEEAYKGLHSARIETTHRRHGLAILSALASRLQEMGYRCSTISGVVPHGPGAFVTRDSRPVSVSGYAMTVFWEKPIENEDDEDNVDDLR